jgi:hypothetical protein
MSGVAKIKHETRKLHDSFCKAYLGVAKLTASCMVEVQVRMLGYLAETEILREGLYNGL